MRASERARSCAGSASGWRETDPGRGGAAGGGAPAGPGAAAARRGEAPAEAPAILFVDDLHWAEDPLLDLLEGVLRGVQGPLLLLATARQELLDRRPAWGARGRNAATLWVGAP